jgi:hypothetical protein
MVTKHIPRGWLAFAGLGTVLSAVVPASADAAMPAPGTFRGTTSQKQGGHALAVHATVGRTVVSRLDVTVRFRCDQKGTFDTAALFVTDVPVRRGGQIRSQGSFDRQLTSADGKAVTGTYTASLSGRFSSARRLTGRLVATVTYRDQDRAYATCRTGAVRITATRGR